MRKKQVKMHADMTAHGTWFLSRGIRNDDNAEVNKSTAVGTAFST